MNANQLKAIASLQDSIGAWMDEQSLIDDVWDGYIIDGLAERMANAAWAILDATMATQDNVVKNGWLQETDD